MQWLTIIAAIAAALYYSTPAHADDTRADLLDGSTNAIIMGPTFTPDPSTAYVDAVDTLYLEPLGFSPTGTITVLHTPETPDFGPSISQGDAILISTVEADYNAGDMSPSDPLTIVGYSQSATIESQVEPALYAYGIPSDDLRFVMLGDPSADPATGPTGFFDTFADTTMGEELFNLLGWSNIIDATTPNNLYPTDVYDINGDFYGDWIADQTPLALGIGSLTHGEYLCLPETTIQDAPSTVDGLTTYYDITAPSDLIGTLLTAALAG